jgi:predicted dehydrogenase
VTAIYRAGIVGRTGKGNYGHGVDEALAKVPGVQVVAVADEDPAGRAAAKQRTGAERDYADYREMFAREKLDLVAICPRWIDQHHAMLMAAAEAGCHIYMEKPFCRTLQECDEVIFQLQMRHLELSIAHITQYSPVLDIVMGLIAAGEIGELLELRGRGKEDQRGGGEDLWVLGSHIFALMRFVAGSEPLTCHAVVMQDGRPITRDDVQQGAEGIGLLAGDHVQATYTFPGGLFGHFASRRSMGGQPSRFALQIFGSKGVIEMESGYLNPAYLLRDPAWSPRRSGQAWAIITSAGVGQQEPRSDGTYEGGHIAAVKDLLTSIEQQRAPRCSAEDGRAIVEMTAAVFESQRLARAITLPLQTRVNPLSLL